MKRTAARERQPEATERSAAAPRARSLTAQDALGNRGVLSAAAAEREAEAAAAITSAGRGPAPAPGVLGTSAGSVLGSGVLRGISDARTEGRPLPRVYSGVLGAATAPAIQHARIHTGARSARLAADLGAAAFTSGRDVFFGSGRWAPGTHTGRRLLVHELTHVAHQQLLAPGRLIQRQELIPPPMSGRTPPVATLGVTLSGLIFLVSPEARLGAAPLRTQYMAVVLFRLLGEQYKPELVEPALAYMADAGMSFTGSWADPATVARAGDPYDTISFAPHIARELLGYLEGLGLDVRVTKEQRDILERGLAAEEAWTEIKALERREGPLLPEWFTQPMFDRAVAQRMELFEDYRRLIGAEPLQQIDDWRLQALYNLAAAIDAAARPLDEIRVDVALARDEKVGAVYRTLWQFDKADPDPTDPPPEQLRDEELAASFVTWVITQPELAKKSGSDHAVRVELLEKFVNWVERVVKAVGDEALSERPAKSTDPPFRSFLSSSPPALPPLYELPLEADARVFMHIEFPDVYDAFGEYIFYFERVRVDIAPPVGKPLTETGKDGEAGPPPSVNVEAARRRIAEIGAGQAKVSELAGEEPQVGTVAERRFARAARYGQADIARVTRELGPAGDGALDLVRANNILRYVGTAIRIGIDVVTSPKRGNRGAALVDFPAPGLYLIRCMAAQVRRGGEEVVRPPSVAYIPILARAAGEIAEARTREAAGVEGTYAALLPQLRTLIEAPWIPADRKKPFRDLVEEIEASGEGIQATLLLQQRRLKAALLKLEGLPYHPDREGLQRELASVTTLLERQETRGLGSAKPLHATFVSDEGPTIPLRMEWVALLRPKGSNTEVVRVSDLTTPRSGEATGTGDSIEKAIACAVRTILEDVAGYGRGVASIAVGTGKPIEVKVTDVALGGLLSEAIDSVSLVLSIAALVAAPVTGGGSLVVMIPVGLAGAATSAYRLLRRSEMHTLDFDRETAMDVLNLVSGVIGVARPAAAGLRLVQFEETLMIIGVGADKGGLMLMGAELTDQIMEIRKRPYEERSGELLLVLGNAFLQAGMLVGGGLAEASLTERAKQLHDKPNLDIGDRSRSEVPPAETTEREGARKTMPGMGGSGEGKVTTPEPTVGRKPMPTPEDPVLEQLARQGVRRDIKPPPPVGATVEPNTTFAHGLTSWESALKSYEQALRVAGGYEVAIVQDVATGEYAVQIGDHAGVGEPELKGQWRTRVHHHPNPDHTQRFHMPAPKDFADMMRGYDPNGPPLREMLTYDLPGVGRGLTEFGFTPGDEKPFYVRIFLPDGSTSELRFSHQAEFEAHWGREKIYVDPDSPLGHSMKKDAERFLSGLPDDVRRKTMAGTGTKAPGKRPPPLIDANGQLTDDGMAFVRNIKGFENLDDAQVRARFAEKGGPLQIVVGEELRRSHAAGETRSVLIAAAPGEKAFSQPPAGTPKTGTEPTMNNVFEELSRQLEHVPGARGVDWSVLEKPIGEIVNGDSELRTLRDQYEKSANPDEQRAWALFYYGSELKGLPPRPPDQPPVPTPMDKGYFLKNMKTMRPDAVEVWPADKRAWVYDITQRPNDPFHGFKTRLYAVAIALATGMTVEAGDYRAALRQTPH